MMRSNKRWKTHCACGQIEVEVHGRPLLTLACYCDDCQAAGKQIQTLLPNARSGLDPDGGTVSAIVRKDRIRIARGEPLLVAHKLRPDSRATRSIASCCNSNLLTRFDGAVPIVGLRDFSDDARLQPDLCVYTRYAHDRTRIAHRAPKHAGVPIKLLLKIMLASVAIRLHANQRAVAAQSE